MNLTTFKQAAGISQALAERWYPHILKATTAFNISTPKRQAAFLAQIGTESGGFAKVKESLNYSVDGLIATFPRSRISLEQCRALGRKPNEKSLPEDRQIKIANLVYGGRYGNAADEGWKFRGRGLKQITFHDNYLNCGSSLGLDLIANPDLLLSDANAAMSAGWFWAFNGCSMFADVDDFVGLTKKINGGTNGLADRQARWKVAKQFLLA
ncbi:glycoside hydrolase family 19 protein [Sinorhizobium medicae]|nr:glycoside hydrolase family 19 protein [Sinorhizobium medicae]